MARKSERKEKTSSADATASIEDGGESKGVARRGSKLLTVARWFRTIIATALVLVVLGAAGVAAVSLVQGTWQMNPVVSGSMRPGFAVGGVVISERIPVNQLVLRDVIVFKDPENPADLIVHRIVHMTVNKSGQTFIKTRGDANNTEDPWTFTIQGKYAYVVRWSVPLLGYAAVAYQNHRGLVLLGAGILLIGIAASTTFGIRRRGEEQPSAGEPDPPDSTPSTTSVSTNGAERPTVNGAERPTVAVTPKVSSTVSRKISSFYDDEERLHSKDPPTLEEYTETRDWNDR